MTRERRQGFTLTEVLTAIVLVGLVLAITMPKMSQISNGTNLRGARTAMLTALNVAKSAAVTTGKCTFVKLDGNAVTVFMTACNTGTGTTEVISNRNFESDYGVGVTLDRAGSALDTDSLGFDPRGIPSNLTTTATWTFLRNGETKTVTVGRYGRLQ